VESELENTEKVAYRAKKDCKVDQMVAETINKRKKIKAPLL